MGHFEGCEGFREGGAAGHQVRHEESTAEPRVGAGLGGGIPCPSRRHNQTGMNRPPRGECRRAPHRPVPSPPAAPAITEQVAIGLSSSP